MLNIGNFIRNMIPSFEKSDVLNDLENSLKQIDTVTEVFSKFTTSLKVTDFASEKNKKVVDSILKELKASNATKRNFAESILNSFKNIKENGEHIYEELDGAINDVVVSSALSTFKAVLFRSVSHYYFMTRYALNLANYFYVNEVHHLNKDLDKSYLLNRIQEEQIEKNAWIFGRLLNVYGTSKNSFVNRMKKLDNVIIPKENVDEFLEANKANEIDIFNNLPNNFIGSPIYTIRLIFAQWEADRYKDLKDKRKLLELRYLHYKMLKEQGQSDINVEKEINYLQKRITDLDYKIAKIEEDIND